MYEQSIYWDDWSTQSIQKANKRDGGARQTIKSHVRGLMDLKVFHQDVQTGKYLLIGFYLWSHLQFPVFASFSLGRVYFKEEAL